jgi:hypothetical protein
VNKLSKHSQILSFKIRNKELIRKFYAIKKRIGKRMKRDGESKIINITNLDCLREMIKLLHNFYESDQIEALEKLRDLKKDVLRKKMNLKKMELEMSKKEKNKNV